MRRILFLSFLSMVFHASADTIATELTTKKTIEKTDIHLVVMGGNDCPPCRSWKLFELPKLQSTHAFKAITFSYVQKWIHAAVPDVEDLPVEVKPYKAQLDKASSRLFGSPQTALIVNGKVYDFYFGTRDAKEVEAMLTSIQTGTPYPFKACLKLGRKSACSKYQDDKQPLN